MSTQADRLDAAFAAAGEVIEAVTFTDDYAVYRPQHTSDGRGGTVVTLDMVETGKCALWAGRSQSREYVSGSRVASASPYLAEMPVVTTVRVTDTLEVNGRAFDVNGIRRDGDWGATVIVELEERA